MSLKTGSTQAPDMMNLIAVHRSGVITQSTAVQNKEIEAGRNGSSRSLFSRELQSKIEGVKFSAHANTRIKSRNIELTPEIMGKLEKAVSGAASKGSRDSLILMENLAFIVNIPNRTVITAMDGDSMKDNVFTNIDSAVIAD